MDERGMIASLSGGVSLTCDADGVPLSSLWIDWAREYVILHVYRRNALILLCPVAGLCDGDAAI